MTRLVLAVNVVIIILAVNVVVTIMLATVQLNTMRYPHTPSEAGTEAFFTHCHDVGFDELQCMFFRYGGHEPQ